jgi:very-short-patch-repair endonuclease
LAAYQICASARPARAARIFDWFAVRGLLTTRSAAACLNDLAQRGRDGTVLFRQIIKDRGPGYVRPASNVEARVKELADEAGIRLRRQVNLGGEEFDGRVDFLEDEVKLVVEVQSELYHWALVDVEADAARRAKLEADGFRFLEIWDTDVWARPAVVVGQIREAIHAAEIPVTR